MIKLFLVKLEKLLLAASLVVLILTIPLMVYKYLAKEFGDRQNLKAGTEILKGRLSPLSLSGLNEPAKLAAYLLTDSILTIAQSYYVDQERVASKDLMRGTLESLAWIPGVSVLKTADRYTVSYSGNLPFSLTLNSISYNTLLEQLVQLGEFFDAKIAQDKKNEMANNDQTGISLVLNALLNSLDSHSSLLSKSEYQELTEGTQGSFGGLGVMVGIRDDLLTVLKPLPHSPASRIGIEMEDKIIAINHTPTFGVTLGALIEIMRGPPGSSVDLTMLRKKSIHPFDLHLTREIIMVDSVDSKLISKDHKTLLYMRIDSFAMRTSDEIVQALNHYKGQFHGIILDLRSNPGGLLDQAIKVADLFLKEGGIVTTRGRKVEKEFATKGIDELDEPMFVLIDDESASASEIVSGALQDNERGVIIGMPSYGKASVQTVFELPNDAALKLTIARYYTPSDRSIQNIGIIPDIFLQPIYQKDKNENILGSLRYKNEGFLNRNLTTSKDRTEYVSSFKGYFKTPVQKNYDEKEIVSTQLAIYLTPSKSEKNEKHFNSRQFINSKKDAIKKFLNEKNLEVSSFLAKEFNLHWQETPSMQNHSPSVKLEVATKEYAAKTGDTISVAFKLSSSSELPYASVFIRSSMLAIDTIEKIVGTVHQNTPSQSVEISNEIKLDIPTFTNEGEYKIEIGAASGGQLIKETSQILTVKIQKSVKAEFVAKLDLIEEHGGLIDGALEKNEKAQLKIQIENRSPIFAHDVELNILNLSGEQLSFIESHSELKIGNLSPGEIRNIFIDIQGDSRLTTDHLALGLSVKSKDLYLPYRKEFQIASVSNIKK